jgi:hypothetical protein
VVPYQNDAHNQQPQKNHSNTMVRGQRGHGKFRIKTPPDVLSFIGYALGFWPQESLVCITLNENGIGATLRIDLPHQPGRELPYARTVAHCLTSDKTATAILFILYASETAGAGQAVRRHHRSAYRGARLTGQHDPRYIIWRSHHTTDPKLRKVIRPPHSSNGQRFP